jgi:hypothetical protein
MLDQIKFIKMTIMAFYSIVTPDQVSNLAVT